MSRPPYVYNGRTAKDWYQMWQEDTKFLRERLVHAQQELDKAEAEVERLKAREMPTLQRKGVATASGTTSDNAALQGRAEKAEARIIDLEADVDRLDGALHEVADIATLYASPTQETDKEAE